MDMNRGKRSKVKWAKQTERGKNLMGAVGMTGKTQPAEQQLQATQPADSPPGTGLNKRPQMAGLAAKTTAAADDVGFSLAMQVRGGSAVVQP